MKLEIKSRDGNVMAELDDDGISLMTVEKEYPQTQYCTWVYLTNKQIDRLIAFLQAAKKQRATKGIK